MKTKIILRILQIPLTLPLAIVCGIALGLFAALAIQFRPLGMPLRYWLKISQQ